MTRNRMDLKKFCGFFLVIVTVYGEQPEVTLPQGTIKGIHMQTISNRKISGFLSIPYAIPPVGLLRFNEPQEYTHNYLGVLNASRLPPDCLQYTHFGNKILGYEDCLYLSVYVPEEPKEHKNPLDVIVHIHGGAFMFLSSSIYGPEYLLDRDVILVNINYRLGILGFMSTQDSVLPGNNGLKDQLLALKWVKKNIKYFGGDPNKITLAGLSAGGVSAHYHVISPQSKGLFNRALILSGSTFCHWAQTENANEKAMIIGKELGCPVGDSQKMIDCLKQRPGEHIVQTTKLFMVWLYNPFAPFGPVVEPSSPNAFIDHLPSYYIKNKLNSDVPLLLSLSADEGMYPGAEILSDPSKMQYLHDNWETILPHLLDYNFTVPIEEQLDISKKIIDEYYGNDDIKNSKKALIEMLGDRIFNVPLFQAAKLHAKLQKSPVYTMMFSHIGNLGLQDIFNLSRDEYAGASHGDDLGYVLRNSLSPFDSDKTAMSMSNKMIDIWMEFIKNSKFSQPWKPLLETLPSFSYMNIGGPDTAMDDFVIEKDFARASFWRSLPMKEDNGFIKIEHEEL